MSNTIKIRRGSGVPTASDFAAYELAYDYTGNDLYVKVGTSMVKINSEGSGTVTNVVAGNGLSGGGTVTATLDLDFSQLTDMTSDISGTTEFILQDGTTESRKAASEIKLTAFDATGFTIAGTVDTSGTPSANEYARFTDANTIEGRSYSAVRNDLGLNIGSDVQAYDTLLQDIADLSLSNPTQDGYVLAYNDTSSTLELVEQSGGISFNGSTTNGLLSYGGSSTADVESTLTYDGSVLQINTPTATSRRLEFRDSTTGANAWIGLPSWDSDAWHFYGPTSTGNQIASKYVNNYWEWYSNGTLSMRLISGVLKMRGLSAYEGGQIELEPATDAAYTNQWTIDNFYDHFRIFNSTTSGEQFTITEAGDMSILTGTKFNLDGRGGHTYIQEESDGNIVFYADNRQMLRLHEGNGEVVINDPGLDTNFRVEGDTDSNLLFADAGLDRIGIGTNSPSYKLDITHTGAGLRLNSTGDQQLRFERSGGNAFSIEHDTSRIYLYNRTTSLLALAVDNANNVGIGVSSPSFSYASHGMEIAGSGNQSLRLEADGSTAFEISARTSDVLLYNNGTARSIRFGVGGGEKFRINSDGNTYVYQTLILNANNQSLLQRDTGGTVRNLIKLDSSNRVQIGDANTAGVHHHYPSTYSQINTDYGYLQIGAQNASHCHYTTDRPNHWFNQMIYVNGGIVSSYNSDLQLRRNGASSDRIDVADTYIRFISDNLEKFRVSSDGRVNYNGWTGVDHITVRSNGHTNSASSSTFYVKFCTVVVDNSPSNYNGVSLSGTLYNGDNNHGNTIDWSVWFNSGLDSAAIAHGGFMRSNGAHWISNILVQRTAGDGIINNGSCTYELYYDLNQNWVNNFYNVATEVHYSSEGKYNVTWNHDQSEVTTLPGTQVVNLISTTYDDANQTLVQTGSAGAPSYSFLAQRNTGMYGFTDNTIGFSCNGTRMLSIKNDGNIELRNDGSSQGASIQRVGGIQFTWDRDTYGTDNVHSIRTDSDNLIISSYDDVTINLDSNNNDASETFDIRRHSATLTGGELLFRVSGAEVYANAQFRAVSGSAAAPGISFASDTDLGFYRNGANNMRFSAGNAIRGTWNGDGLVLNGGSLGVNVAVSTAADGRIDAGNDIVAYSSDKRLKENIRPINNALHKVNKLSGFIYNWNKLANEQAGFDMEEDLVGVYAQDVEEVLPEAVKLAPFDNDGEDNSKSGENYLTVQYEKMVPLLIEAIKEQQQQINELKEKLNG